MQRQRGLFKGSIKILFLYRIAFYKFGLVTPSQIVIWHPKSVLWVSFPGQKRLEERKRYYHILHS